MGGYFGCIQILTRFKEQDLEFGSFGNLGLKKTLVSSNPSSLRNFDCTQCEQNFLGYSLTSGQGNFTIDNQKTLLFLINIRDCSSIMSACFP